MGFIHIKPERDFVTRFDNCSGIDAGDKLLPVDSGIEHRFSAMKFRNINRGFDGEPGIVSIENRFIVDVFRADTKNDIFADMAFQMFHFPFRHIKLDRFV